ncbi:uncharacterized protein LOC117503303 [Thalassophryne amazonica]|uniref:uncharacterized protein LOC117503303 n=1 Tax=Thalassophryne amazonica TaxID=390379 RepID=UPI001471E149|nr:uncharacterized protein LOC117503303 [Thalassophryne amazonica]
MVGRRFRWRLGADCCDATAAGRKGGVSPVRSSERQPNPAFTSFLVLAHGGMAGRSRRAWFSVLLGLVVGFTLASRLILPKAAELKKAGHKRKATPSGCGPNGAPRRELWPPQNRGTTDQPGPRSKNFLFVGVMTAQKYLNNRAVAAHRYVTRPRIPADPDPGADGWVGFRTVILKKRLTAADFHNGYLHWTLKKPNPTAEDLFVSKQSQEGKSAYLKDDNGMKT